MMQQILRRKVYADGRAKESLCSVTKTFSHTIKQLLYQNHKIFALCNIEGELARTQPIFCGTDAVTVSIDLRHRFLTIETFSTMFWLSAEKKFRGKYNRPLFLK